MCGKLSFFSQKIPHPLSFFFFSLDPFSHVQSITCLRSGFAPGIIPSILKRTSAHLLPHLLHTSFGQAFDCEPQPCFGLLGGGPEIDQERTSSPHQPSIAATSAPYAQLKMAPVTRRSLAAATDDAEAGKSSIFCSSFARRLFLPSRSSPSHLLRSKFLACYPLWLFAPTLLVERAELESFQVQGHS